MSNYSIIIVAVAWGEEETYYGGVRGHVLLEIR